MAIFDPEVFDLGTFDATDPIPTLFKVSVHPLHGQIAPGQSVLITIKIVNVETTLGSVWPLDTSATPLITIFDPSAVVLVDEDFMYNTGPGEYRYRYETELDADSGAYSVRVYTVNGEHTLRSPKMVVFRVIQETV